MDEETTSKRGDAAWKEQRDAVARKNADAHKRAQAGNKAKATATAAAARVEAEREAEQLRNLNQRIAKRRATVASADRI